MYAYECRSIHENNNEEKITKIENYVCVIDVPFDSMFRNEWHFQNLYLALLTCLNWDLFINM